MCASQPVKVWKQHITVTDIIKKVSFPHTGKLTLRRDSIFTYFFFHLSKLQPWEKDTLSSMNSGKENMIFLTSPVTGLSPGMASSSPRPSSSYVEICMP